MAISSSSEFHQKPFTDKFFSSRRVSKDNPTNSNPSFRIYYGDVSSAVPFTWETRPGTPKHHTFNGDFDIPPPLTPPPSYYSNKSMNSNKQNSRSRLILLTLLRRMSVKKVHQSSSSPSSNSSSSMWSSSSSRSSFSDLIAMPSNKRRRFASWGGSDVSSGSSSKFCFGIGKESERKGSYSVKKALLSIVGRGSPA